MSEVRAWNDPSADPIGDVRRYLDLAKEPAVTKVEVNDITLDALRAARSDAQRAAAIPGWAGWCWGVDVYVDREMPDGKARVTWSDGRVEMIPNGA